jgi:hypothetical protein
VSCAALDTVISELPKSAKSIVTQEAIPPLRFEGRPSTPPRYKSCPSQPSKGSGSKQRQEVTAKNEHDGSKLVSGNILLASVLLPVARILLLVLLVK